MELLTATWRFFFDLSIVKKIISLAFNKVLLLFMLNGSPRNDTMVVLIPGSCAMNLSRKLY